MTENMGKQIRAGRQRSSLTQEKLAETLGVTPQAVSKWERGESLPDIALLPELSAALGSPTFAIPYTELEDILTPWE